MNDQPTNTKSPKYEDAKQEDSEDEGSESSESLQSLDEEGKQQLLLHSPTLDCKYSLMDSSLESDFNHYIVRNESDYSPSPDLPNTKPNPHNHITFLKPLTNRR